MGGDVAKRVIRMECRYVRIVRETHPSNERTTCLIIFRDSLPIVDEQHLEHIRYIQLHLWLSTAVVLPHQSAITTTWRGQVRARGASVRHRIRNVESPPALRTLSKFQDNSPLPCPASFPSRPFSHPVLSLSQLHHPRHRIRSPLHLFCSPPQKKTLLEMPGSRALSEAQRWFR